MTLLHQFLAALICILAFIHVSSTAEIKCYECTNPTSRKCAQTCTGGLCGKAIDTGTVRKFCVPTWQVNPKMKGCVSEQQVHSVKTTCYCNKSLCNSGLRSSHISAAMLLLLLCLVAVRHIRL